jgi:hypothetical protein
VKNKSSGLDKKVISAHRKFLKTFQSELNDDFVPERLDSETLRAAILDLFELNSWVCLVRALLYAHAAADSLDVCREGLNIYPNDSTLLWWRDLIEEHLDLKLKAVPPERKTGDWMSGFRNGAVYMRQYPWVTVDERRRSDSLIEKLKNEFLEASEGKCIAARSSLNSHSSSTDELGVFATQDISRDDVVLTAFTPIGVSNDPEGCPTCSVNLQDRPPGLQAIFPGEPCSLPCCNDRFCSSICADFALQTFHPPICSKDLSFLPLIGDHDTSDWSFVSRLLLRCIASAVHTNTHPLHTTLLSRFKASYTGHHVLIFNFSNIIDAFKILQALNVDIFADLRFDTWVLHTIQCRIANNKAGGTNSENGYKYLHVNPLYCFFNHDCEPNCTHIPETSNSSIELVVAARDIKKGEEIFTSYLEQLDLSWEARQKVLFTWIRGECGCVRCIKEAPRGHPVGIMLK